MAKRENNETALRTYKGSCHCGSVQFTFISPQIKKALRCKCSMCRRKGELSTSFTVLPDNVHIEAGTERLSTYRFNTRIAKHSFCRECGISPFYQTRLKPGEFRFNLGCLHEFDPFSLPLETFEGDH